MAKGKRLDKRKHFDGFLNLYKKDIFFSKMNTIFSDDTVIFIVTLGSFLHLSLYDELLIHVIISLFPFFYHRSCPIQKKCPQSQSSKNIIYLMISFFYIQLFIFNFFVKIYMYHNAGYCISGGCLIILDEASNPENFKNF